MVKVVKKKAKNFFHLISNHEKKEKWMKQENKSYYLQGQQDWKNFSVALCKGDKVVKHILAQFVKSSPIWQNLSSLV